jgi:hypothetical protein
MKARIIDQFRALDETPRARSLLWVSGFGIGWGILAIACIDTSPVTISKDGGDVIFPDDAGSSDVFDPFPACSSCIAAPNDPGPGCGNELKTCRETDPCSIIYDCAYASGCVFKRTQDESVACAFPCAAQLTNAYAAAISAALALTKCFHDACGDVCEVGP